MSPWWLVVFMPTCFFFGYLTGYHNALKWVLKKMDEGR